MFFLHITVKWSYSCKFVSCSIVLFLYLHKQPFITAQSQVITAQYFRPWFPSVTAAPHAVPNTNKMPSQTYQVDEICQKAVIIWVANIHKLSRRSCWSVVFHILHCSWLHNDEVVHHHGCIRTECLLPARVHRLPRPLVSCMLMFVDGLSRGLCLFMAYSGWWRLATAYGYKQEN